MKYIKLLEQFEIENQVSESAQEDVMTPHKQEGPEAETTAYVFDETHVAFNGKEPQEGFYVWEFTLAVNDGEYQATEHWDVHAKSAKEARAAVKEVIALNEFKRHIVDITAIAPDEYTLGFPNKPVIVVVTDF